MASDKTEMRKKKDVPQNLDEYPTFYGMTLDPEQKIFRDAIWNPDIDVVFCNARAGTGKTTIAVGMDYIMVSHILFLLHRKRSKAIFPARRNRRVLRIWNHFIRHLRLLALIQMLR